MLFAQPQRRGMNDKNYLKPLTKEAKKHKEYMDEMGEAPVGYKWVKMTRAAARYYGYSMWRKSNKTKQPP